MINVSIRKIGLSFILAAGLLLPAPAQSPDYSEIFNSSWQKALLYIKENDSWIRPALEKYNIPYNEAIAIVFPELVRYSALRDKMEITLLKTLYRNLGDDYADFSIGVFQVKPSFAAYIHKKVFNGSDEELKKLFNKESRFDDIKSYRAYIISDLEIPETELKYIIAFYKICDERFGKNKKDPNVRIKLFATAYNSGVLKNEKEIMSFSDKKFFNTSLFSSTYYSYADVSLFWYNQYRLEQE